MQKKKRIQSDKIFTWCNGGTPPLKHEIGPSIFNEEVKNLDLYIFGV